MLHFGARKNEKPILVMKSDQVLPFVEKYYKYMETQTEISGVMRKQICYFQQILLAQISGSYKNIKFVEGNLEALLGKNKSDFLLELKINLNNLLSSSKLSDGNRLAEIQLLCLASRIPHEIVRDWLISSMYNKPIE